MSDELKDTRYSSLVTHHFSPLPVPIFHTLLQHAAVFADVDIAFTAEKHKFPVIAEIPVPFDELRVIPGGRILLQFLIFHAVKISAEIETGFVHWFISRVLFKVPDWLLKFHKINDQLICMILLKSECWAYNAHAFQTGQRFRFLVCSVCISKVKLAGICKTKN
jgi:hypothetical protein